MADQERYIPAPVRRSLRQESGFGCCVCGSPVFEYHHIRDYATAREHDPKHMMTLCPNHHHEATVGALTEAEQRAFKAAPKNISDGYSDGLLRVTEPGIAIRCGSVDLVGKGFKFLVDVEPILALDSDDDGRLLLSLDLYDATDQLLLSISKNEWISGDPIPWDIEFGHRWLRLRRKHREITLEINAVESPVALRGRLVRKGQTFSIDPTGISIDGVVAGAGFQEIGLVGMQVEVDTTLGTLSFGPESRYAHGMIVSWPDRAERLRKCFEALVRLETDSV